MYAPDLVEQAIHSSMPNKMKMHILSATTKSPTTSSAQVDAVSHPTSKA